MPDIDERMRDAFRTALAPLPVDPPPVGALKARAGDAAAGPHRPWWRIPAVGGLAVTAAVTAVLTVPGLAGPEAPWGERPAAAAVLDRAADAAAARPQPPVPGPGQYLYTRQVGTVQQPGWAVPCWFVWEHWQPARAGLPERISRVDGLAPVRHDWVGEPRRLPKQSGCTFLTIDDTQPGGATGGSWQTPDAAFVRGLSTDPEKLYEQVLEASAGRGRDRDSSAFVYLTDLLGSNSPYLTPALRSAVLRAVAMVPGITRGEGATDVLGRPGVLISGPDPAGETFAVDPVTGAVLGTRSSEVTAVSATAVVPDARTRPATAPR